MSPAEISIWVPAASALAGALVGALVPVLVTALQSRSEHRRERMRLAVEIALAQYRKEIDVALVHKKGGAINPPSIHLLMTLDLLERIAKGKEVGHDDLKQIRAKAREWTRALDPLQNQDKID